MMEACIPCRSKRKGTSKDIILKEIRAFLKAPEKYYVRYNPKTGFYKFELIKK